jgi:hypothetical protein
VGSLTSDAVKTGRRGGGVEWGLATHTLAGNAESGDRHLVQLSLKGVLLAAVDGVGHGDEAAVAARIAVSTLEGHCEDSVLSLLQRCHDALSWTRGAVISLASYNHDDSTLTWAGVGNVEGLVVRTLPLAAPAQEVMLLRGGVVGHQLPRLYASVIQVSPGDTLLFATDGVRADFVERVTPKLPPQLLADRILSECAKKTDDALVLVTRFLAIPA